MTTLNEENIKNNIILPWLVKELGFNEHNLKFEESFIINVGRHTLKIGDESKKIDTLKPRLDILVKDSESGKNLFIIEVKSETTKIDENDINQAISYARLVDPIAPFTIITNGRDTKLFKTVSKEEIKPYQKFATESKNFQVTLSIEDYFDALQYFIGYSKENLLQYCQKEYELNVKNLKGSKEDITKFYIGEVYEPNQQILQYFRQFLESDSKAFALVGNSGMGKTCWICNTAEQYIDKNVPVFFYRFKDIRHGIFETIADDLNWSDEISPILSPQEAMKKVFKIFKDRQVLIFLDGLDERNLNDNNVILNDFFKQSHGKNVKLIVTCKTYYWESFLQDEKVPTNLSEEVFIMDDQKTNKGFILKELEPSQLERIIEKYHKFYEFSGKIDTRLLQEFKRNTYLLRVAFEYASTNQISSLNYSAKELLSSYYDKLTQPFDKDDYKKLTLLNKIAKVFYDANKDSVNVETIISQIELSENIPEEFYRWNILSRRKVGSQTFIEFYFSKLRDFIIAYRVLKLDSKSKEELKEILCTKNTKVQLEVLYTFYLLTDRKHKRLLDQKLFDQAYSYVSTYENIVDESFFRFKSAINPFTADEIGAYCDIDLSHERILTFAFRKVQPGEEKILFYPTSVIKDRDYAFDNYKIASLWISPHLDLDNTWEDIKDELSKIIDRLQHYRYDRRFDTSQTKNLLIERVLALTTKNYNDHFKIQKLRPAKRYLPLYLKEIKGAVYQNNRDIRRLEDQILLDDITCLEKMGIDKIDQPIFPDWETNQQRKDEFSFEYWGYDNYKHHIETLYKLFLDEYQQFISYNFPTICSQFPFFSSLPAVIYINLDKTFDSKGYQHQRADVITCKNDKSDKNVVSFIDVEIKREERAYRNSWKKYKTLFNCISVVNQSLWHLIRPFESSVFSPNIPWHMEMLQRFIYGTLHQDLKGYFDKKKKDKINSFNESLANLSNTNVKVFEAICKSAIKKNDSTIHIPEIKEQLYESAISDKVIYDSINLLAKKLYIYDVMETMEGNILSIELNFNALDEYAKLNIKNYRRIKEEIPNYILSNFSDDWRLDSEKIAQEFSLQRILINTILEKLEGKNLIETVTAQGGAKFILDVSSELKQIVKSGIY